MKPLLQKLLLLSLLGYTISIYANSLDSLQLKIQNKEQQVLQKQNQKNIILLKLKQEEQSINKINQNLQTLQYQINKISDEIKEKNLNYKNLSKKSKQQELKLNKLAIKIYQLEKLSFTKKIISDENQKDTRIKHILYKLYKEQENLVTEINKTKNIINIEKQKIQSKYDEKTKIVTQEKLQQKNLKLQKQQYQSTLTTLNLQLAKEQKILAKLKQDEIELRNKITSAERQEKQRELKHLVKQTTKDLGKPHKQFNLPVNGKIIHHFGSIKMGELHWKGIVIQAPQGSDVKAIANGRIILAGHLQGYGLMVIIKHGKNDLSLYGYNQKLHVKVGDTVVAQQKIATVGQAQGQSYSGTYFEISHKGNPVNPIKWLKK